MPSAQRKGIVLIMDEMMKIIGRYPNGTFFKVSWGLREIIIEGVLDTIYETDNGLEGDEGYQEYFACAFRINKIVQNLDSLDLKQGQLIEISKYNSPSSIELEDGTVIWQR